eukprot:COSAG03_NODE_24284_length_273_cov_0.896552_1_plen_42_part_01
MVQNLSRTSLVSGLRSRFGGRHQKFRPALMSEVALDFRKGTA